MLRREQILERISLSLATLRSYIDLKGLIHLFDTHIIAEDFMANLLNLIFDYSLQNLNYIHLNQPGIDLGDPDSGIAVQVTADKSRRKIQDTIDTFVEKQLYIDYPQLHFLILNEKQRRYSPLDTRQLPSFDSKKHILDIGDLIVEINKLPLNRLETVADYLAKAITFPESRRSINVSVLKGMLLERGELTLKTLYYSLENGVAIKFYHDTKVASTVFHGKEEGGYLLHDFLNEFFDLHHKGIINVISIDPFEFKVSENARDTVREAYEQFFKGREQEGLARLKVEFRPVR
jgi:hypothetical protein